MLLKFPTNRLVKPLAPDPRAVSGSPGANAGDSEEALERP